jgi:hypothetical protein
MDSLKTFLKSNRVSVVATEEFYIAAPLVFYGLREKKLQIIMGFSEFYPPGTYFICYKDQNVKEKLKRHYNVHRCADNLRNFNAFLLQKKPLQISRHQEADECKKPESYA